jgi:hypothetical protein
MIHRSLVTSFCWMTTHWSRGVGVSPACQNILSNSITGSPVISPKRKARVDFPDAPRPMMRMRSTPPSVSALPDYLAKPCIVVL